MSAGLAPPQAFGSEKVAVRVALANGREEHLIGKPCEDARMIDGLDDGPGPPRKRPEATTAEALRSIGTDRLEFRDRFSPPA